MRRGRGLLSGLADLWSVLRAYLRLRRRAWLLIPGLVVLPVGYTLGLVGAPDSAGTEAFLTEYSGFFQSAAQVIATLLVAFALEVRVATRHKRLGIEEAMVLGVFYMALAELAAIAALSPALPGWLQRQAFALTVGAGTAALLTVMLMAPQRETSPPGT